MMDDLCCCEYIDKEGEKSHMLGSLCNCEALDETFDRLLTCGSPKQGMYQEIFRTFEDRLRIPWLGGARKVHLYTILAWIILPTLILLGSINFTSTCIIYTLILPSIVYMFHSNIRLGIQLSTDSYKEYFLSARKSFYPNWLLLSIILTISSIFLLINDTMKISSKESFILISLCIFACLFFHISIIKGQLKIATPYEDDFAKLYLEDVVTCIICRKNVLKNASHCKYCDKCFSLRDHHCIWLNICIYKENDRWFITGLFLFYVYLLFHTYLTFTTVCYPKRLNLWFGDFLYPSQCLNAYFDFSHSISTSVGFYVLVLIVYISPVLLQQIYRISTGKRRSQYRRENTCKPRIFFKFIFNWVSFWST